VSRNLLAAGAAWLALASPVIGGDHSHGQHGGARGHGSNAGAPAVAVQKAPPLEIRGPDAGDGFHPVN